MLSNQKANLENGIIEHRKEVAIGDREIPMSSCSFDASDMVYAKRGKPSSEMPAAGFDDQAKRPAKPKGSRSQPTKSDLIKRIKKDCGTNDFLFITVNTENEFQLDGVTYKIDSTVTQYSPKPVKDDLLYDMDKIVCVKNKKGEYNFYDQDYSPIESGLISRL